MNVEKLNQWTEFVSSQEDCHVLQLPAWGKLKEDFGWKADHFIYQSAGAQILFKPLPLGLNMAYIPKGPVGEIPADFWEKIKDFCKSKKSIFVRVEADEWLNSAEISALIGISKPGKSVQPLNSIMIDISKSPDEILATMKQKTRYNVRLAKKKEIVVKKSKDVQLFYQLMLQTGDRDEFGVHAYDYYQKAYDLFKAEDKVDLLIAEFEGKPLAGLMMFYHGKRAWYFYGASSNEERNRMPTYLLQYEAMMLAKKHGCLVYDLWGIPDESEEELENNFEHRSDGLWGVYRFKRGFGGDHKRSYEPRDIVIAPFLYKIFRQIENYRAGL